MEYCIVHKNFLVLCSIWIWFVFQKSSIVFFNKDCKGVFIQSLVLILLLASLYNWVIFLELKYVYSKKVSLKHQVLKTFLPPQKSHQWNTSMTNVFHLVVNHKNNWFQVKENPPLLWIITSNLAFRWVICVLMSWNFASHSS